MRRFGGWEGSEGRGQAAGGEGGAETRAKRAGRGRGGAVRAGGDKRRDGRRKGAIVR